MPGLDTAAVGGGALNILFWGSVTGTGTFDPSANMLQVSNFGTGLSGLQGGFSPVSAKGETSVIFDFETAPEPTSPLIWGIAMAACGLFSRFSQKA